VLCRYLWQVLTWALLSLDGRTATSMTTKQAGTAGIDKDKLTIALEPEAASLHCRHLPIEKNVGDSDASLCKYPIGTKYIVVDAGVSENTVRELHKASGGAWGGTKVDDAFEQLIEDILGTSLMVHGKRL
ncbi:hypothetical protein MAR_034090, partial [Mya arenaria]